MILSVLSSPALVSGLMVVRAKNPVHSVLFPILVFCDTSGLLILLGLDFSAMIFPVVHIGAIAVSFLFVVMMFNIQIAEIHEEVLRYLPVSGIIGLIFWWEMFFILDNETIPLLPTHRNTTSLGYTVYAGKVRSWTNLETLGNLLYTYYSVWFLVSSLILLVAMIGAIVLTMHRTTKVKRQDVFRRNALDSRRTIIVRPTMNKLPGTRSYSSGGSSANYKEIFKAWVLKSHYRDFPGLVGSIDSLLKELEPYEILFLVHTFPRDFNLLNILSPQDIKNIIAHVHKQWKPPKRATAMIDNTMNPDRDPEGCPEEVWQPKYCMKYCFGCREYDYVREDIQESCLQCNKPSMEGEKPVPKMSKEEAKEFVEAVITSLETQPKKDDSD
nr:NADH dehydrogenase subunit 6 [Paspalum vaginatum]